MQHRPVIARGNGVEDITENMQAEEVLCKRNNELEKCVDELISALAAKNEQLKIEAAERMPAEDKFRAGEEIYSSIFNHIGIGISVISPDMEIIFMNTVMKTTEPPH
jgi:PAS domain-containing protein